MTKINWVCEWSPSKCTKLFSHYSWKQKWIKFLYSFSHKCFRRGRYEYNLTLNTLWSSLFHRWCNWDDDSSWEENKVFVGVYPGVQDLLSDEWNPVGTSKENEVLPPVDWNILAAQWISCKSGLGWVLPMDTSHAITLIHSCCYIKSPKFMHLCTFLLSTASLGFFPPMPQHRLTQEFTILGGLLACIICGGSLQSVMRSSMYVTNYPPWEFPMDPAIDNIIWFFSDCLPLSVDMIVVS